MLIVIIILIIVILVVTYISVSISRGYKEKYTKNDDILIKPKRVVVSFTTLPSRTANLKKVINSILANTIQPDIIYVNVPEFSTKENKEYIIESSIANSSKVKINICDTDFGPVTKLYPTLLKETDPDTTIICVDDDSEYDEKLIEHLLLASQKYPESCICLSGWNYIDMKVFALPLLFSSMNGLVKKVDILQCYNGVLYKRKFFDESFVDYVTMKKCKSTDDIMISKYLKSKNIDILSIPYKFNHKNINMNFFNSLSITNLTGNNWIKCIKDEI